MFQQSVLATEFSEHPVANPANSRAHPFDVPIFDSETIQAGDYGVKEYCTALMNKLFSLEHFQVMPFLNYQCSLVEDQKTWLLALERLLANNHHLFTTWPMRMKMELILIHTAILFREVETGKFRKHKKYDISEVKQKLRTFKSFIEQLDFLYELKTEFLQDKFKVIDYSEIPFDQLILIEIEKIEQLRVSIEKIKGKKSLSKNNLSDQYIDNQEFILKMNISKRTAQFWRDKQLISFIQIGSKIYYKLSDVETMLQQNYIKPFKKQ
ncbi:MAG: helix-turn-helix domain-containing protein [Bacteroidia bacterium]|jgi:hypothetical protein|nr:helix-turn-helix domain-containing protein [Bacteroidia bacterium]